LDQIERVLGLIASLGDDNGDAFADVAHDLGRDGLIGGDLQFRSRQQPGARHWIEYSVGLGSRVYGDDTGGVSRAVYIDRVDSRVRIGAAKDRGMYHPRQRQVVCISSGSRDQPRILTPPDTRAEDSRAHYRPPAAAASRTARTMFC